MAFNLKTDTGLSKEERYRLMLSQINSLISDENNFIANTANIVSVLKNSFEDFLWVGFYFTDKENQNELVLGPFQGNVACTRISFGKGVCGTSALKKETIIVGNVDEFPGHIVCDSNSRSEIVVPVIKNHKVMGVLDIDSGKADNFDESDKLYLEKLISDISILF